MAGWLSGWLLFVVIYMLLLFGRVLSFPAFVVCLVFHLFVCLSMILSSFESTNVFSAKI